MIAGYEGEPDDVARRARRGGRRCGAAGGLPLGRRPGESWLRSRYHGPYLRDALLDRGVMVETLETATTWTRLRELHTAVADALGGAMAARGTPALVGCHVSHVYPAGASLYFTWMARRRRAPSSTSGARRSRPRWTRSSRTAARSPTTTPSAATTRPGWPPRWASWAWRRCAP